MQLAEIHRYPVKSLRGRKISKAAVESIGIEGDRRWLVVDASGCFQTIRELPRMVQIEAEAIEGGIRMIHSEAGACNVSTPQERAASCDVTIWGDTVRAVAAGAEADAFLSGLLGTKVRLVYLANPKARSIDAKCGFNQIAVLKYGNCQDDRRQQNPEAEHRKSARDHDKSDEDNDRKKNQGQNKSKQPDDLR